MTFPAMPGEGDALARQQIEMAFEYAIQQAAQIQLLVVTPNLPKLAITHVSAQCGLA